MVIATTLRNCRLMKTCVSALRLKGSIRSWTSYIAYSIVQYKRGVKGNKEYSQSPALAVVKKSSEPLPMSMMHVGSWIHVPGRVLNRFRLLVFINVRENARTKE
jgi:hypothetical protein